MDTKSSNSNFQKEIEREMILRYAEKESNNCGEEIELKGESISFDGCSIEVDGHSKDKLIACEAYAHVGKLKAGQVHKVAQDALKLIYLDKKSNKKYKKALLFADEEACKPFEISKDIQSSQNIKWIADCLREYKIEPWIVPLSEKIRAELLKWQKEQGKRFKK